MKAWLLLLALPASASAQMGVDAPTLEWLAADADVIVRARVLEVRRDPPPDPTNKQFQWIVVTLGVTETFKGPRAETLRIAEFTLDFNRMNEGWKEAGTVPLWFLKSEEKPVDEKGKALPDDWPRYQLIGFQRMGPPTPAERGFSPVSYPLLTMKNLDAVDGPELIEALKVAVAEGGNARPQGHGIMVPHDVMGRSRPPGDANRISVPIDARLEAMARRMIRDPDAFLVRPGGTVAKDDEERKRFANGARGLRDSLREEGIKALRHFKSDENAALLRPLLSDTAVMGHSHVGPGGPIDMGREYHIRKAAFETLRGWGFAVDEPVLKVSP